MALDFGFHDDVVFADTPLRTVLSQVRFPPVLSLLSRAGLTGFQTALRDQYPVLKPAERATKVDIGESAVGVQSSSPVWKLTDDAGDWTVSLAVDFVALETTQYRDTKSFLTRFERILHVLHRTIQPADSVRVGLRKVNILTVTGRDTTLFNAIVRPEMLGPLAVTSFPAPINKSFSQLEFADDLSRLVVRYGIGESGEESMGFVIDLDYFTEVPYQIDGGGPAIEYLRHCSEGMTSFFHWSLVDEYKLRMSPSPRLPEEPLP